MRALTIVLCAIFSQVLGNITLSSACAQQMGEIAIEDIKTQKSAYQTHQESVIALFTAVRDSLHNPLSVQNLALSKDGLVYLNAVYLHCSVQKGTCPLILEALLNLDILHAAKHGTFECPNLTLFWRNWLENDMEERQKYLVRTAHLQTSAAFNQTERPRYIKCKDTVQSILTPAPQASSIATARFAEGSEGRNTINRTLELLTTYQSKVPNVFALIQGSPEIEPQNKKKK
ncbi:MAG: hypothetical protein QY326_04590 [Bdellovibrionota bacterium]|nr:MAG: hypothetical protein QY326_04590 [Bdellovibrionota bacterium]